MVPSHALRLQSMIRAMTEVILPAIDPSRQLAVDQANILVGNLRILLEQNDKAYLFRMTELREYTRLTEDLVAAAAGGEETGAWVAQARGVLEEVAPVAALAIPAQAELTALVLAVRAAADGLLRAANEDGAPEFRQAARALVYAQGGAELLRERVWLRAAGFERDPDALPSIESLL